MLQTKIASRANELSRRIYASLPFGYRVARLLIQLRIASILEENYGKAFYAEFIKAGVSDMPPISGEPAETWRKKILSRGPRVLPKGYGGRFGRQLWGLAKSKLGSKYGSDDNVADVMQNVMAELYGGTQQAIKGKPLESAESYIKTRIMWRAKDMVRSLKRQEAVSLSPVDEEDQIDLIDESALTQFVQQLGPTGRRVLHNELRKVDPRNPDRAWEWIMAEVEGFSGKELAEQWGVSPSAVTQWVQRYRPRIQDAFRAITE